MNIADVKSRIAENGAVDEIETAIKMAIMYFCIYLEIGL